MRPSFIKNVSQYNNMQSEEEIFEPKMFLRPGLTEKDIIQLKEVFEAFDTDADGVLNPLDIRSAMTSYGFTAKKETIFHIMAEYDETEVGELDFNTFLNMCSKNHSQKRESKNHIRHIFLKYDRAKRGYFDINDLKRVSRELGEKVEDEVLEEMIKSVDSDMDGRVTFDDFHNAMTKKIF